MSSGDISTHLNGELIYDFPDDKSYTGIVLEPDDLYENLFAISTIVNDKFLKGKLSRYIDIYPCKKNLRNKSRIKSLLGGTNSRSLLMDYDMSDIMSSFKDVSLDIDLISDVVSALNLELLNKNSDFRRIAIYKLPHKASELFSSIESEDVTVFGKDYLRILKSEFNKKKGSNTHYLTSLYQNSQIGYDGIHIYFLKS